MHLSVFPSIDGVFRGASADSISTEAIFREGRCIRSVPSSSFRHQNMIAPKRSGAPLVITIPRRNIERISGRCQGRSPPSDADWFGIVVRACGLSPDLPSPWSLAVPRKRGSMSRRIAPALTLLICGLSLAACGYSTGDRAASGGLIGAGGGAALGAVTGGSPLTGALLGGAVGAVAGGVSSPNSVNLGRPTWR
jgi:osmotically inducible lipoprotein OsmB